MPKPARQKSDWRDSAESPSRLEAWRSWAPALCRSGPHRPSGDSVSDPGEALVHTSSFGSVPFLAEPSDLSAVADMLRGPLTELATSAGLFTDDFASLQRDQQREIAFSMHRRATELHYLVENLLLAATMREGHFLARARNLALAELISEAEPAWTPLPRHRGQTLRVRVSNQL